MSPLDGLNADKLADTAFALLVKLRSSPEGRAKLAQEIVQMRREAQEKGATE